MLFEAMDWLGDPDVLPGFALEAGAGICVPEAGLWRGKNRDRLDSLMSKAVFYGRKRLPGGHNPPQRCT